jgi:hypothetical protein
VTVDQSEWPYNGCLRPAAMSRWRNCSFFSRSSTTILSSCATCPWTNRPKSESPAIVWISRTSSAATACPHEARSRRTMAAADGNAGVVPHGHPAFADTYEGSPVRVFRKCRTIGITYVLHFPNKTRRYNARPRGKVINSPISTQVMTRRALSYRVLLLQDRHDDSLKALTTENEDGKTN